MLRVGLQHTLISAGALLRLDSLFSPHTILPFFADMTKQLLVTVIHDFRQLAVKLDSVVNDGLSEAL